MGEILGIALVVFFFAFAVVALSKPFRHALSARNTREDGSRRGGDGGGAAGAGVREPRGPRPSAGAATAAVPEPDEDYIAA